MRILIAVMCAIIVASVASVPASRAATPQLTGKMKEAQYLVGTWSCTTKVAAMGNMQAATHKGTVEFEVEPGNTLSMDISSDMYSASGFIGYLDSKKLWWNTSTDNFSGVSFESGPDSTGSVSVATGWVSYGPQRMPSRDTITKTSDTKYEDLNEVQQGGKWHMQADAMCVKASNKRD